MTMAPFKIFISYSHNNADEKDDLLTQLKAACIDEDSFDLWDDRRIEPGALFKVEIKAALHQSGIAILLISDDFLTSKFITEVEVPTALEREISGLVIIPVIAYECPWKLHSWIADRNVFAQGIALWETDNRPQLNKHLTELVYHV